MIVKPDTLRELIITTARNRYWIANYYEPVEYIYERVNSKLKDIFYQGELNFKSNYDCINCIEFCFKEVEKEIQQENKLMEQEYGK